MSAFPDSLEEYFSRIFKQNSWGNDESVSGEGSSLLSPSVHASIKALDELIRRLGIRSISDAPCGDFNWIPLITGRFPYIKYRGFDIVPDLIDLNRQKYPDYEFQCLDVTKSVLPQSDIIFCRDLFLHLSNSDIAQALRFFKTSGSRFLLVTNVPVVKNQDLIVKEFGSFRHVDLTKLPFALPEPSWHTDYLSLWSLDKLGLEMFDIISDRCNAQANIG